ncbi:MAG: transcriptional repressor [Bacteroidales bacterium]|jgi:Fur family ferric uptake transcriptional regulator|nr:transcriptional repressor [Bacteroidales bacterium]MBO7346046.1 transcriptional repressor [Bacteroidales bacterium]MBQ4477111.1 transcriptional repressor [Bacteroidales bacterium]MBR4453760.1 transcriptional repressor [Bacteroidales bacterium]MCR5555912.1 transcriptional repressor [Bacteroidales bacterium]
MNKSKQNSCFSTQFYIYLSEKKYSKTSERKAIAEAINKFNSHFTINDLHAYLINNKYHISLATLYNNIHMMTEAGLLQKLEFASKGYPCYEKCTSIDHHSHIYNIKNQHIKEFSDPRIPLIIEDIEKKYKIKAVQYKFTIYTE